MRELGHELGGQRFAEAYQKAQGELESAAEAIDFASKISRKSAREFIHTVVTDMANSDKPTDKERAIVNQVRLMWGISGPKS